MSDPAATPHSIELPTGAARALTDVSRNYSHFHRPELDVIRFFAFFLVFLHHVLSRSPETYEAVVGSGAARVIVAIANSFGFGLSLFFFLSAYLITELLLREKAINGTISLWRFYLRRILRIWPLYFLGVGVGFVLACGEPNQMRQFVAYSVFLGNFYSIAHEWSNNPMTHLWSISIEEQFYMVWPFAVLLFGEAGLYVFAISIGIASMAQIFYLGNTGAHLDYQVWANTLVQFLMFASGTLVALALKGGSLSLRSVARCALATIGIAAWFAATYALNAKGLSDATSGPALLLGYTLIAIGCALIFGAFLGIDVTSWKALIYLGQISFGLYVFHLIALRVAVLITHRAPMLVVAPVALTLTIALAALSYRCFERPFLQLKSRLATVKTSAC